MPEHQFAAGDIPDARVPGAGTGLTGDLLAVLTAAPRTGWLVQSQVHDPPVPTSDPAHTHHAQPSQIATGSPVERSGLSASWRHVGAAVVVRASGEVDLGTAPTLAAALRAGCLAARPPGPLVVDLTGIRFFSAAGLTALIIIDLRCQRRHLTLKVVATHRSVLMPLHITGLDTQLTIVPDAA
ncbi:STAS domain-containing protein [Actinokineospora sp. NBRC 105648]|uniref:STAS domain-containing protein n=1 Tax=Actinokineospora sp. NBRC 105648 TaxID=3032206 RepID=UPI0024A1AD96|nr:STAS domain-containing protein [Actinokineospora sp. NBRC 105648]GLZ42262.1 hypothetical protein Acsp05_58860 [Actinokineospora sp. NBRC 105648]